MSIASNRGICIVHEIGDADVEEFQAGNMTLLFPPRFVQSEVAVRAHWLVFSEICLTFRAIPSHDNSLTLVSET